jgi:type I restriction enzyme M protein
MIFLQFLSLRYERRRVELERRIADPESDYHMNDPQVAESILEDPEKYRAVGSFVVPK